MPFHTILIPTDCSSSAEAGVQQALAFAAREQAHGQLSPQYPIPIFSGKNLIQGLCALTLKACAPPRTPNTSAGPFQLGRQMV